MDEGPAGGSLESGLAWTEAWGRSSGAGFRQGWPERMGQLFQAHRMLVHWGERAGSAVATNNVATWVM